MVESQKAGRDVRNIQGFREWRSGAPDAGKMGPAWDAGMAPQEKDGEGVTRCPSCSQNAHGETVLVRCAQSRAALATPSEEM